MRWTREILSLWRPQARATEARVEAPSHQWLDAERCRPYGKRQQIYLTMTPRIVYQVMTGSELTGQPALWAGPTSSTANRERAARWNTSLPIGGDLKLRVPGRSDLHSGKQDWNTKETKQNNASKFVSRLRLGAWVKLGITDQGGWIWSQERGVY